jgi:hypothetical protein
MNMRNPKIIIAGIVIVVLGAAAALGFVIGGSTGSSVAGCKAALPQAMSYAMSHPSAHPGVPSACKGLSRAQGEQVGKQLGMPAAPSAAPKPAPLTADQKFIRDARTVDAAGFSGNASMLAIGNQVCSGLEQGNTVAASAQSFTVNGIANPTVGLKIVKAAITDLCPGAS